MAASPVTPRKRWSSRAIAITTLALLGGIAVMVLAFVSLGKASGFLTELAAEPIPATPHVEVAPGPASASVPANGAPQTSTIARNSAPPETSVPSDAAVSFVPATAAQVAALDAAPSAGGAAAAPAVANTPAPDVSGTSAASGGVGSAGSAGSGGGPSPVVVSPVVAALQLLNMGASQACGNNTCNVGLVCCNLSCGTCAPPGASCDQTACENAPTFPAAIPCGLGSCSQGQVCCNQSCGLCAAPGEACSQRICS